MKSAHIKWPVKLPDGIKIDHLVAGGVLLGFLALFAIFGHHAEPTGEPKLSGKQAAFTRDCVMAVLEDGAVKDSCKSFAAMQDTYHFNAQNALIGAQARMSDTARRIARGDFRSRDDYRACIASGVCAPVPMLDPGEKSDSPAGRAKLAEFWHLAQDGRMTAANCAALDLCQALVKLQLMAQPPPLAQGTAPGAAPP